VRPEACSARARGPRARRPALRPGARAWRTAKPCLRQECACYAGEALPTLARPCLRWRGPGRCAGRTESGRVTACSEQVAACAGLCVRADRSGSPPGGLSLLREPCRSRPAGRSPSPRRRSRGRAAAAAHAPSHSAPGVGACAAARQLTVTNHIQSCQQQSAHDTRLPGKLGNDFTNKVQCCPLLCKQGGDVAGAPSVVCSVEGLRPTALHCQACLCPTPLLDRQGALILISARQPLLECAIPVSSTQSAALTKSGNGTWLITSAESSGSGYA